MPNTYFIKLTPLHHFFFGGENKFEIEGTANYLVKSNYYPQQTSLLGLTRYLLLQSGSTKLDADLIGQTGFRMEKLRYGIIESLSPVLLYKEDVAYYSLPLSYGKKVELLSDSENGEADTYNVHIQIFGNGDKYPRNYSYKDEYKYCSNDWLISEDGRLQPKLYTEEENEKKGFFIPHEQVGILKNYQGVTKESGFYKMTAYRMAPDCYFGFYLTLSESNPQFEVGKKHLTTLGGEQSKFILEVEERAAPEIQFLTENVATPFDAGLSRDQLHKIALISDAYVDMNKLRQIAGFVIGKTKNFRFLKTTVETKNHYRLSKDEGKITESAVRSTRKTLLEKGSVIYCKSTAQADNVKQLLESYIAFRTIGYNHFISFQ